MRRAENLILMKFSQHRWNVIAVVRNSVAIAPISRLQSLGWWNMKSLNMWTFCHLDVAFSMSVAKHSYLSPNAYFTSKQIISRVNSLVVVVPTASTFPDS
jgi:hypothetical protein